MASALGELDTVRIRLASRRDVPELARVHVESWHAAYAGIISARNLALTTVRRSEARFRGYFLRGAELESPLHVAEGPEGILGYVNGGPTDERSLGLRGEIFELYLLPEAHGRGVGRRLLGAGLWSLAARGQLPVLVWTLAKNNRARRFYVDMHAHEIARGSVAIGDQRLTKVAYGWFDYLPWPEHAPGELG
ncbi:GNAT family N-acetyltransferase [Pseudenhygromyxa sp. WMMC2535]|uniref:GNAT family N-acetyltransferase n=1 Tax=Pseudenhygromyxa sp. WMMC2535 TaxID=2712867 RepID=UPI001557902B|nr:GNAT family N-acetyltransferase [Pseudenhygromyxa sp. WMMC2535]NVB43148.1 GNAT family N-acetyltransferase [Pseudenhygromyxa sp. WMMC2535]